MTKSAKGTVEKPGRKVKQKSWLNKSSLRQGWHKFSSILEYKANWSNKVVLYVDPKNTSLICSKCDHLDKNSRNKEDFNCTSCNYSIDADLNHYGPNGPTSNLYIDGIGISISLPPLP